MTQTQAQQRRHELGHGLIVTIAGDAHCQVRPGELTEVVVTVAAGSSFSVDLEAPLGLGVGLWHPDVRSMRTLPPDWSGSRVSSLVQGAPLVALYDAAGQALWGVACSELVAEVESRGGISEEHKQILWSFTGQPVTSEVVMRLAVATNPRPLAQTIGQLSTWQAETNQIVALAVPESATQPVYSTWYTYTQDVTAQKVLTEATLAAELGCGSVFIDDGWQSGAHGRGYGGTGDWLPDVTKFPDLPATLAQIADLGVDTVLWIAPLLLGHHCQVYQSMKQFAPEGMARLNCQVLDPRHREVRDFVVETCRRLVAEYGAAGLKIDFLNNAMSYQGTDSTGDLDDVGEAMQVMLAGVREALSQAGRPDAIIEFRQPYVSPAITAHGNCLRVGDCPADAWVNRAASIDLRMFVRGAVVHSDPLMWAPEAGAAAVAQQFLSTFFSVPQVSMPLAELDEDQRAAVAHHLGLWTAWKQVALFGELTVHGVEQGYTQAVAEQGDRAVVGLFRPEPVDLDAIAASDVLLLHASPAGTVLLRGTGWQVTEQSTSAGQRQATSIAVDGLVEVAADAFSTLLLRRRTP